MHQAERGLTESIETNRKKNSMEDSVHADTVAYLMKRQEMLSHEASTWEEKYNRDNAAMDNKLKQVFAFPNPSFLPLNWIICSVCSVVSGDCRP
jgi:hypothetical protein